MVSWWSPNLCWGHIPWSPNILHGDAESISTVQKSNIFLGKPENP